MLWPHFSGHKSISVISHSPGLFGVCELQTFVPQISGDHCFLRHVGVSVDSWGSVCKQLWVFAEGHKG